ncbi:hypothetical protein [Sinorhizobium medicae]
MRKVFVLAVWAFISLCVVAIITLPVNLQTQLIASLLIVTLMAIIKLVDAGGEVALDCARLRNGGGAALCLLAHYRNIAAHQPA